MAFQSMLILIVGAVPEYHIDQEEIPTSTEALAKHVRFANNFTSIATEVSTLGYWYLNISPHVLCFFSHFGFNVGHCLLKSWDKNMLSLDLHMFCGSLNQHMGFASKEVI